MTNEQDSKNAALERLTEALVEDILATSEAEILSEAMDDGVDPVAETARLKALYKSLSAELGKTRLAAAKAAAQADRSSSPSRKLTRLDPVAARARLQSILEHDPDTKAKLTIAARKGEGLSDADVQSMLEELEELGIRPPDDDVGGGE